MPSQSRSIGSDPEFMLVARRNVIPAHILYHGQQIGHDGCRAVGELRPDYAYEPEQHFQNIQTLLSRINSHLPNSIEMRAGSAYSRYSLGGHVHIGRFATEAKTETVPQWFLTALDYFVGAPLILNCRPVSLNKRLNSGYGWLSSYRPQPWGLEYRTPSSWLVDPVACKAVLALTKMVAQQTKPFKDLLMLSSLTDVTSSGYTQMTILQGPYKKTLQHIEQFDAYDSYKDMFLPLFARIANSEKWDERKDVLVNWGIRQSQRRARLPVVSFDHVVCANERDLNCREIAANLTSPVKTYVYGLSKERDESVAIHTTPNDTINSLIVNRWVEQFIVTKAVYCPLRDAQLYIGLSKGLRRRIGMAKETVKTIIEDYAKYSRIIGCD